MQGGVSINLASCDSDKLPTLVRGIGCRVTADGALVTIFVPHFKSEQVRRDLPDNGNVAVTFSQPSTHRTIQVKGDGAAVRPLAEEEQALIDAYRLAFVQELQPLGFPPPAIRALLACPPQQLLALSFKPRAAFDQTPGPDAGQPLQATP